MSKKLILLSTALFTCLIFFFSCNKESQTKEFIETGKNSISVNEAKSWYANHSSQQSNSTMAKTSAKKINTFYPKWDKAITTSDKNYEIVECPLKFDTHPGFIISPIGNTNNNNVHGITRLLILKNKKDGSIRSALMNIYSASGENDSTITYSNKGKHFSGYIFFTYLNGEFINGWLYNDGIIIKQSKRELLHTNTASKALPPDQNCENIEIKWYEQDCFYYTDGTSNCTDWYYIGSSYVNYCPGGGGGDGGVDNNDQNECISQLDGVSINIKESVELGNDDGISRTKFYNWKIYQVSSAITTAYLSSKETGVQKKGIDNIWRFVSFDHTGINSSGVIIGWSLTAENVSAITSITSHLGVTAQVANIDLNYDAEISFICKGFPISTTSNGLNASNNWYVNE